MDEREELQPGATDGRTKEQIAEHERREKVAAERNAKKPEPQGERKIVIEPAPVPPPETADAEGGKNRAARIRHE